jgi:hypothetical protein
MAELTKKDTVRVILVHPQTKPHFVTITNGYHDLQALVGGILSASHLHEDLAVFYNDEGLLLGLPPNVKTATGALLTGSLVVAREDAEGETIDATEPDMDLVLKWLDQCERPGQFLYDNYDPIITSMEKDESFEDFKARADAAAAARGGVVVDTVDLGSLAK